MKTLLVLILGPYVVAFLVGVLFAFTLPPLCWWLERKAKALKGEKRGVVLPLYVDKATLDDAIRSRFETKH